MWCRSKINGYHPYAQVPAATTHPAYACCAGRFNNTRTPHWTNELNSHSHSSQRPHGPPAMPCLMHNNFDLVIVHVLLWCLHPLLTNSQTQRGEDPRLHCSPVLTVAHARQRARIPANSQARPVVLLSLLPDPPLTVHIRANPHPPELPYRPSWAHAAAGGRGRGGPWAPAATPPKPGPAPPQPPSVPVGGSSSPARTTHTVTAAATGRASRAPRAPSHMAHSASLGLPARHAHPATWPSTPGTLRLKLSRPWLAHGE